MLTKQRMLEWIEGATYMELLAKWRFEPVGSPWFSDEEVSKAFEEALKRKKVEVGHEGAVAASKLIGWGRV